MMRLGLTGGMGSGKSIVAEILRIKGFPVYNSDERSKELCDINAPLKQSIVQLLGDECYIDGKMDRQCVAEKIFRDPEKLKAMNKLVHPIVEEDFLNWEKQYMQQLFVVQESAILFEAGFAHLFDWVIGVVAPEELRIDRVCRRSGLAPEAVRDRMRNQMKDAERIAQSDFTVINDGFRAVLPQVEGVLIRINAFSEVKQNKKDKKDCTK